VTPVARGWLPTAIGLDSQSQQAVVRWLEFGSAKLAEPFFAQTVERLRHASPPAKEARSDLEALLELAEGLSAVTPAGFIFHVSHCGSTLIANALKTADRAVVVSEAPPLSILLHPDSYSFGPSVDTWDRMRQALFRALISIFAHYRGDEPAPVVIKFPSWNILFWSLVRSYWPDVPAIVIIRDPVEVMMGNLNGGGWMEFKKSPELAGRLLGWKNLPRSVQEMSDGEFAARVLRRFYTCAREMADQGSRILDYQEIDVRQIRAIAALFHVELPASRFPIEQILGVYSKDANGAQPFQPDGPRKQKLATGLVRSAAHQWATAAYRDLKSR
jgi:hypothetical protein